MISGTPGHPPDPPELFSQEAGSGPESLDALADEGCAQLAQQGSRSAVAELVRRYTSGLYHLFLRIFSDRDLAEDATQEVFLKAYRKIAQFDPRRRFRGWLYAIAWNHARDHFRRRSRRGDSKILSLSGFRVEDDSERRDLEPADSGNRRPDEEFEARERTDWVREAMGRLRPGHRAMLVLREYEGLSYDELAELLDCKVGTVKSRLNRARLELKDALLTLRPNWVDRRGLVN